MARQFGMGAIYAVPSGTNPTPVPFAVLKDCTVSWKVTKKVLRGQWKFGIDVGEGPIDVSIKIGHADFRAGTIGMLLAGGTTTANSTTLVATGESWAIPGTPWQVTVSQSATWAEDGGVLDITAGKWLTRVASAPATGQYSVAAGVYTFAAADTTHNLSIVYSYTSTTQGSKFAMPNLVMGPSVGYLLRVYNVYPTPNSAVLRPLGWSFPNAHFSDYQVSLKAEDWAEESLTAMAIQDSGSTNVFTEYVGE